MEEGAAHAVRWGHAAPTAGDSERWQHQGGLRDAVPVGGGEARASTRAPSSARLEAAAWPAGPGRASNRCAEPRSATQPHWCGGRRRELPRCRWAAAGHTYQAPPNWRPPRGLRGLAGLRDDAPSEARGADGERAGRPRGGRKSGGGQARRRPENQRGHALWRWGESNPRRKA